MPDRVTEDQLGQIYDESSDALYRYASRRCGGDRALTEDVVQETWLRAVREWRRWGAPRRPLPWLLTVARNLIVNHFKRRGAVPLDDVEPLEVLAAVDENSVDDSTEIASVVSHALTLLPQGEARLLEEFHYDHYKVAQLAERYGISERAVEGRLRRARERLRRTLIVTLRIQGGLA